MLIDNDAVRMDWMQGVSEFVWWLLHTLRVRLVAAAHRLSVDVQRDTAESWVLLR